MTQAKYTLEESEEVRNQERKEKRQRNTHTHTHTQKKKKRKEKRGGENITSQWKKQGDPLGPVYFGLYVRRY